MLEQRTICLIPIPFSELSSIKRRPVLIISNTNYNYVTDNILVMAITSNIDFKKYTVSLTNNDMDTGNLLKDSLVRIDKIYSINKLLVIKEFGKIRTDKFKEIINVLNEFLKD